MIVDKFGFPILHSPEFKKILESRSPTDRASLIQQVTHLSPLLVFWVTPQAAVLDAGESHRSNPPGGNKAIFSDKKHMGHLRGRAALFGKQIYVVVYAEEQTQNDFVLSRNQYTLLKRSAPRILSMIKDKNPKLKSDMVDSALFVTDSGDDINL